MELANIVPWGRSFEEYRAMFELSEQDLNKRILGCGDGPASFNAEATKRGSKVISCDPVYRSGQRRYVAGLMASPGFRLSSMLAIAKGSM